jgi:hypothetical protein
MLFKKHVLDGIASGDIDLAFRRWRRPTVRAGTQLRTPIGVVQIDAMEPVDPAQITDADARRAGFGSRDALLASLDAGTGDTGTGHTGGPAADRAVFRIELHHAGRDPREELRQQAELTPDEVSSIDARLHRLDKASRHGPWTLATLELIADRPAIRAADLAAESRRPKDAFKADVRKLKELGLTESLGVGYRLSPRGRAYLAAQRS